jgi:hypothetical protein
MDWGKKTWAERWGQKAEAQSAWRNARKQGGESVRKGPKSIWFSICIVSWSEDTDGALLFRYHFFTKIAFSGDKGFWAALSAGRVAKKSVF